MLRAGGRFHNDILASTRPSAPAVRGHDRSKSFRVSSRPLLQSPRVPSDRGQRAEASDQAVAGRQPDGRLRLRPGTSVGAYEIVEAIGAGGMGEVYRAHDTKLQRDVALKVLPQWFATNPDRVGRFVRESHVLASLSHPNIAAIYGVEDVHSDEGTSTRALILELVDGSTLTDRIALDARPSRSGLPVEEAVAIARQIADAMRAAHDIGVIHRDLKPENIKVRADGTVKVLDFGVSKVFSPDEPETNAPETATGVVIGTPNYMSPEQARGLVVDKRCDIWAFGCVLYEMLTGRRAFEGESFADTVAGVVSKPIDWSALPDDVPAPLRALLRRCLDRDLRTRVGDFSVVQFVLDEHAHLPARDVPTVRPFTTSRWWRRALVAAAVLTVAALAWVAGRTSPATSRSVARVSILFPERPITQPFGTRHLTVSPDGSRVAFLSNNRLWVRKMDDVRPVTIASTDGASSPFFSANGKWVGLFDTSGVKKIPVDGGPAIMIATTSNRPGGAAWRDDDEIVFATSEGLYRVAAAGGAPALLAKPDRARNESLYLWPQFVSGRRFLLFTIISADSRVGPQVAVLDLDTRQHRTIVSGSGPQYVSSGHVVYSSGTALKAIAFDARSGEVRGDATTIAGVQVATAANGATNFAISDTGTLVYSSFTGQTQSLRALQWIDRTGKVEPIPVAPQTYYYPVISPDGTRAAVERTTNGNRDIWILDLKRLTQTQLTDGPNEDILPIWTLDGRRVWFTSNRTGDFEIYSEAADGATGAKLEFAREGFQTPNFFTPDGTRLILYDRFQDLGVLDLRKPDRLEPLLSSEHDERLGDPSPDGQWMAYESDETGNQFEIMLRSFPRVNDRREKISINGGRYPRWGPKGSNELYYVSPDGDMMAASITLSPTLTIGGIKKLFTWEKPSSGRSGRLYDVSPVDGRFLVTKATGTDSPGPTEVSIVLNWIEELKRGR
jgi:eukaryotic-like serine/threonine-protein kinase